MTDVSGRVAEHATIRNAIDTGKISLLGVVDTPDGRRALVLLPSGGVRTVKVGDGLRGGRVVAIGPTELHYRKASRNRVLTLPK